MPKTLRLTLILKAFPVVIFLFGFIVAAVMNRSVLMVALIAAAMTASHMWSIRALRSANLAKGIAPPLPQKLVSVFVGRLILGLVLFITFLGLSALFQETWLARGISVGDIAAVGAALLVAMASNSYSDQIIGAELAAADATLKEAFNAASGAGPREDGDDGEIIEGEIAEPSEEPGDGSKAP